MLPLLLLNAFASRYSDLPPLAPDEIYTPLERSYVEVDGIQVATVDSGGDKPALVFIHGLSSYTSFWEYQLEAFTDTHRVLALDLPGYGASGRPDAALTPPWYADFVDRWLEELEVDSATVVGHSMGGQIALTLTLEHPERVDRLVLSAPAGLERFKPGHARWMKDYWHEGRAMVSSEMEIRHSFVAGVFNKVDEGVERLIEERVRMRRHPAFRGTSVAVSRSVAGMLDYPVVDRLGEIDVPTLIIFGTHDHLIPNAIFNGGRTQRVAEEGQRAISGSELVMIPKAGHTVHHDAPDAFNRALADFLDSKL